MKDFRTHRGVGSENITFEGGENSRKKRKGARRRKGTVLTVAISFTSIQPGDARVAAVVGDDDAFDGPAHAWVV
jgi:hypothetical protein